MKCVNKTCGIVVAALLLSAIALASEEAGAQAQYRVQNGPPYRRGQSGPQIPVEEMTVQELKNLLDHGKELIIIDISTAGEFREGHVKGSLHLDPSQMRGGSESFMKNINADKNDTMVFVCQTGNVSRRAAMLFKQEGFDKVFNLAGGKIAWLRAGYPLEEGDI